MQAKQEPKRTPALIKAGQLMIWAPSGRDPILIQALIDDFSS